ncbi:MAG: LamG-like jellyroll fold domain-containing protein, partial [Candidatus Micrarchaeia archaeon]
MSSNSSNGKRAQIALEFLIVYSFVLVIFIILFALVASQRAITLSQQEYAELQLQVQDIALYIDQAYTAGNGYFAAIPIVGSIGSIPYNVSISTTGTVIGTMKIGTQTITTYGFSTARNLVVNGTLQQSGNGISVYQIPIYKGYITIGNANGNVYIDQKPPSMMSFFENMFLSQPVNQKVGSFNGANYAYGSLTSYFGGNNPLTAVAWAYITPSANGPIFGVTNTPPGSGWNMPFLSEEGLVVFGWIWGVNSNNPISYGVPHPGWYMLAITYNPSGSGSETFYVNGVAVGTASGQYSSSGSTDYWTTYISGAKPGGMINNYNSLIANVQAYSTNLTASQIMALYKEGIGGAPISNAIISWWPLNGNLKDYSGDGHDGVGSGMQYGSVIQFNAKVINKAGTNATSIPIGFVTSKGAIGTIRNFIANDTNSSGVLNEFLTANSGIIGATNVTITPFNGNATIAGNLVGWWPLDLGYGNSAYDLSGYGNTGTMQNVQWAGMPLPTSLLAPYFNGQSSSITGNLLFGTTNLTISAWVNNTGTGTYWQNIAEIYGNQNTHETLDIGVTAASGNAIIRWSNQGNTFQSQYYGGIIKPNTWYLVTGVWNGNRNTLSVYVNGNLVATGAGNGTVGTFVNGFNIGGSYPGMYTFNGLISNVQIYNTALTQQQIMQQYRNGISALPISNTGLIGWWPLNGNANDYSSNGNNGIA